ncbi:hypothetical protein SAMN06272721_12255 [Arthrobacter sp. P2b]|nr:hypothetical protein SAMN06272721_12255 [Arthrobacter sp. P2b]
MTVTAERTHAGRVAALGGWVEADGEWERSEALASSAALMGEACAEVLT